MARYSALDKINFFIVLYGRLFAAIFKPRYWSSFFTYALFQFLFLSAITFFYLPVFQNSAYPLLRLFLPADAFHYPRYYMDLPGLFSGIDTLILGPIFWIILSAAAVHRYGALQETGRKNPFSENIRMGGGNYFPLLIFWIIQTVLLILIAYLPSLALDKFVFGSPRRKLILESGIQLFSAIVLAALLYVIPLIILDGKKLFSAIAGSLVLFKRNLILSFFIVLFPLLPIMVLTIVLGNFSFQITTQLNPELIPILLYAKIFLGIFANMFVYFSAVAVAKELS